MTKPTDKRADFSRVKSTVTSTEEAKADFGNVRSNVTSTEEAPIGFGKRQQTYTVVSGDSLSLIAKRVYGKASRWPAIFDANRDQITDPDRIHPGQVLKLPDDDKSDA